MLKTRVKKPAILMLSFVMTLSMSAMSVSASKASPEVLSSKALAQELINKVDSSNKLSEESLIEEVTEDLNILSEKHVILDQFSIDSVTDQGNVIYAKHAINSDVTSYWDVWQNEDGSEFIHIVEGDIQHTLEYAPDGKLYIDGNEVTVSYEKPEYSSTTRAAGYYSYFYNNIISGTNSWNYNGSSTIYFSCAYVDFTIAIASLGTETAKLALGHYFGPVAAALGGLVLDEILSGAVYYLESNCPTTTRASFKDYRIGYDYQPILEKYYMHRVVFWPTYNYSGQECYVVDTYYEVRTPV